MIAYKPDSEVPLEAAINALHKIPEQFWPEVLDLARKREQVFDQEVSLRERMAGFYPAEALAGGVQL